MRPQHLILSAALAAAAVPAAAQTYPDKPVTIVVSASVGGSIDGLTRQLQPFWEPAIGKNFVVDNKDGASGITGVRYFMSRPDDGYNILVATEAHITATLEKTQTFSLKDMEFINVHQYDPISVTVLSSRYKTFDELMAQSKAKPNSISWGTPPTGAPVIIGKLLARDYGMPIRFVPQANGAAADTSLLGGHIDIKLGGAASDGAELGDKVRVVAHAAGKRLPYLPDTPTLIEIAEKNKFKPIPVIGTARLVVVHASLKTKHPDRFKHIVDSYKKAFHTAGYQEVLKKTGQDKATQFMEPGPAGELARTLFDNAIKMRAELGG